jgi:antitoxin (DNA-binding transcriptional repressor) of toxin-antitoxin stability system
MPGTRQPRKQDPASSQPSVSATYARRQMGELLDRVRFSRERIAIECHGKVVAYVIPAEAPAA